MRNDAPGSPYMLTKRKARLQHLTLMEEAHRLLAATRGQANPDVGDPRAKAALSRSATTRPDSRRSGN
jgi:hypothetical protein